MIEKTLRINSLYDVYGSLLTGKQQEFIHLYYGEDLSLGEIAIAYNISRQAVHDILRRGENMLREWEEKLGLLETGSKQKGNLRRVFDLLGRLEKKVVGDEESLGLIAEIKALMNPFAHDWAGGG